MAKEVSYKNSKYRQLIKNISCTSKYHEYEVEDVMTHFIHHVQQMLARDLPVKLPGIGTIKIQKMHVERRLNGKDMCYTTCRLSIPTDTAMMRFLKESYLATEPKTAASD